MAGFFMPDLLQAADNIYTNTLLFVRVVRRSKFRNFPSDAKDLAYRYHLLSVFILSEFEHQAV